MRIPKYQDISLLFLDLSNSVVAHSDPSALILVLHTPEMCFTSHSVHLLTQTKPHTIQHPRAVCLSCVELQMIADFLSFAFKGL